MALAVVRSLDSPRALVTSTDVEDYEQEIVDQYALAQLGAGLTDGHVRGERHAIVEFARFVGGPLWSATPEDADRYLTWLRRDRGQARRTIEGKASSIARFFDFMILRYQGDVHALTGVVVEQPVDEFNRPASTWQKKVRVPPGDADIETMFVQWGKALPDKRKYLTAARDYVAASLWRRVGLRINESRMLDLRDWRPDLGGHGNLHVRFGKGSRGRGPASRMVPTINGAAEVLTWWLTDVRHQFGDDWDDPDAPMLPSERRDLLTGRQGRVGDEQLRVGLATAVEAWLPDWTGRLTPHVLRHYCASSLYQRGMDLKAIQELLGHQWLETTTIYVHVHEGQIARAWDEANARTTARLNLTEG